jgi:hypothetical protein
MPEPKPEPENAAEPSAMALANDMPQVVEPVPQKDAAPEAATARTGPTAEPTNDDLIKMLLASLPATPARNAN